MNQAGNPARLLIGTNTRLQPVLSGMRFKIIFKSYLKKNSGKSELDFAYSALNAVGFERMNILRIGIYR